MTEITIPNSLTPAEEVIVMTWKRLRDEGLYVDSLRETGEMFSPLILATGRALAIPPYRVTSALRAAGINGT